MPHCRQLIRICGSVASTILHRTDGIDMKSSANTDSGATLNAIQYTWSPCSFYNENINFEKIKLKKSSYLV